MQLWLDLNAEGCIFLFQIRTSANLTLVKTVVGASRIILVALIANALLALEGPAAKVSGTIKVTKCGWFSYK